MTSSCWPTWICSLFIKFLTDQLPGSCDLILPTVNASGFGPVSTSVFYLTCQFFFSPSNATGWLCFIETPQEYSFWKSNAMQRRAKAIQIFPAVTNEVLKACLSREACILLPLDEFSIHSATDLMMLWILLSEVCCSSQSIIQFHWCIRKNHSGKEPACRHV